jgi:hypothetical protein
MDRGSNVGALGDRALVVAMRCGSGAAIREFVLRFHPLLATIARRFVGAPTEPR